MKIDPEKMATDLDYWNNVSPEGAEFYTEGDSYFFEGWYRRVNGRRFFMSKDDFETFEIPLGDVKRQWVQAYEFPYEPPMIAKPVSDTKDDEVSILRKRVEELEARVNSLTSDTENEEGNNLCSPSEPVVGEEHIGRLVMVRDYDDSDYNGPFLLDGVNHNDRYQFRTNDEVMWKFAKLYTGPTSPNWIEHDGHGVPDDLQEGDKVLAQFRNGRIFVPRDWKNLSWCWGGVREEAEDVMRYTKLEC